MAQDHRLPAQRFELKYLIDEALTPGIRDFVSCHLELDEYGVGWPDLAYSVHTLYLDSDDLRTFLASTNGSKNRFKLRLRYYDDNPATIGIFPLSSSAEHYNDAGDRLYFPANIYLKFRF